MAPLGCKHEETTVEAAERLDRAGLLELVSVQSKLINALREDNNRLTFKVEELEERLARRRSRLNPR